jgi:o-succinylbenzoate synthase
VLTYKETFILTIENNGKIGIGECAIFRGLSCDDVPEYELKLQWLCDNISQDFYYLKSELHHFPSIIFGLEQALLNLELGGNLYFESDFTQKNASIKINGLIWMGDVGFMKSQIREKLNLGFDCIKLKIGVDWNAEQIILQNLRKEFTADQLEIRVDANGGFTFREAKRVLEELHHLQIHSIEQPIKAGQIEEMKLLCATNTTPIALDEELIGCQILEDKQRLLENISPQYIILKPALLGGFAACDEWISLAQKLQIGWWITSALESNIGLNAIAQYTYTKNNPMPQGLGTGMLFTNNFDSNLDLLGDQLKFRS